MKNTKTSVFSGHYPGHANAKIFEFVKELKTIKDEPSKIAFMRGFAGVSESMTQAMHIFTYLLTNPDAVFDLPSGKPDYIELNTIPENAKSFHMLLRKIGYFLVGNDQRIQNHIKREKIFCLWLESLHQDEAKLLIALKDRDFKYIGVTYDLLKLAYPAWVPTVYIEPKKMDGQIHRESVEEIKRLQEEDFKRAESELAELNSTTTFGAIETTEIEAPAVDPKDYVIPIEENLRKVRKSKNLKKV